MNEARITRFKRQVMRAEIMYVLLKCYNSFYMIKLQSACLNAKSDYESIEKLSNTLSSIFNTDCKPSDLIKNDNDICNNILDEYGVLSELLDIIKDREYSFSKDDVMSFMEYEYHNNCVLNMRNIEWREFSYWAVCAARRIYPLSYIRSKSVEYRIWNGGSTHIVDTRLFRRFFIRLEKDFWDIVEKRRLRSILKQEKK